MKPFYQNFFGWSEQEYLDARNLTCAEVRKYFDPLKKFPCAGPQTKLRHTVQTNLVRGWPDLFVNRHGPNPPTWFDAELISRSPSAWDTKLFDMKNVVQQFISFTRKHVSQDDRRIHRLKQANRIEEGVNNEDEDDEDDDDACKVLNKRPRTSWLGRTTPSSETTPLFMPPSPHTAAQQSQASVDMEPSSTSPFSSWNRKAPAQVTASLSNRIKAKNPASLMLYITRVTIMNQTLILERDRYGLVDNLFERGRLIEPYIQELVFGNPLDSKPTFLWHFDDTSDDKPRSIRNRPGAEAAIYMLKARAERAEASGIQLFDAPDCDTAALVPVHEVTRKDDFVQRVSFELEVDDEGNGDDNNDNDQEDAEKASKVDSAYGSRNGELQIADRAVKEEVDSKPNITWAGHQQQENNVESESESEEDEDIRRYYK